MAQLVWLALMAQVIGGGADAQALHVVPSANDIVWRSKPTAQDMATFFPQKARIAEQAGWAILECLTAATGEMKECHLISEAPAGYGFGAAALKLSSKFRIDIRKTDPATLEHGVVMIPIHMVTPTGAPLPPRDYLAGQPAALVTVATGKAQGNFPCPSAAAPDRQCSFHPLKWRSSPSLVEGAGSVRSANATSGRSTLQCRIQADYRLTACGTSEADPKRKSAMLALAATLVAPEETEDKTITVGQAVVIDFNWSALSTAVNNSVLTKLP